MAITYDWNFDSLTVKAVEGSLSDIVVTIDWRRIATDGTYTDSVYGRIVLDPPNPDSFISFSALTKSQVEGWVVASLTQEKIDKYDTNLAANIERQKNPTEKPLSPPWG